MDTPALRELLERLHAELEHGQPVDEPTRGLLRTVLGDIHEVLEREQPVAPADVDRSLPERLRESTWHLEESHPKLTATVTELVEALAGIFR